MNTASPAALLLRRSGVERRSEPLEPTRSSSSFSGSVHPTLSTATTGPTLLKHNHHRRRPLQRPSVEPPTGSVRQVPVVPVVSQDAVLLKRNIGPTNIPPATTLPQQQQQQHVSLIRRNRLGLRHNPTSNTSDSMSIDTSNTPQTTDSSTTQTAAAAAAAATASSIPLANPSVPHSSGGPLHPLRHGTGARLARSHGRSSTTNGSDATRIASSTEPRAPTEPTRDNNNNKAASQNAPLVQTSASPARPVHKANLKADMFQKRSLQLRTLSTPSSPLVSPVPLAPLSAAPHATTTTMTSVRLQGAASASSNHRRYPSSDQSLDHDDGTAQRAYSNHNDPSLTATPDRDTLRLELSTRPYRPLDRYGVSEPSHAATVGPASPPRPNAQHQHLLLKHQDKVHRRRKSPTSANTSVTLSSSSLRQSAPLPQPHQQHQPTTQPHFPTPRLAQQPPRPSPQQYPLPHQPHLPPRRAVTMEQMSPPYRPYDRYQQQEISPRLPLPPSSHSPLPVGPSPSNSSYDHPYDTSIDEGGRLTLIRREKPSFQNPGPRYVESDRNYSHGVYSEAAGLLRPRHLSQYGRDEPTRVSHQPIDKTARLARASSSTSDYETDASRGDDDGRNPASSSSSIQQQQEQHDHQYNYSRQNDHALHPEPTFSNMSASQMTPDVAAFFDHATNTSAVSAPRSVRDDDTYDYGDRDDNIVENSNLDDEDDDDDDDNDDNASQGSLSYEQRRQKMEREREARAAAAAAAKAELDGPFMQKDDVEHYRKAVDTPLGRTAAGVAVAATLGCILLGPVGLLVGAAAVGIGAGYMQIPEEQRQNMNNKATEAAKNAQESVFQASEKLSNSCALSYRDSGIADHVPVEIDTCCTALAGMDEDGLTNIGNDASVLDNEATGERDVNGNEIFPVGGGGGTKVNEKRKSGTPTHQASWLREKKGKVACLRKGKVIPLAQIHALDPAAQPRAWLDVLASAETSHDEKIEAIEEILIQAKDKQKSRIFVDEGILDCLLWTIERFFEKQAKGPGSDHWAHPTITSQEATAARLSATCCLTLGKSYCAAIHTEGDLLLMSLYDRGTVPEERQLAQMLLEVPHHTRSTRTDDPTIITPGKEVFSLKQMTLPQAEELAASIATLATSSRLL